MGSSTATSGVSNSPAPTNAAGILQPSIMEPQYMAGSPPATTSMSIGSIIESGLRSNYSAPHWSESYPMQPVPTRHLTPEYGYGGGSGVDHHPPTCSSDGCYSPGSEGQQPSAQPQPYLPPVGYHIPAPHMHMSAAWAHHDDYTQPMEGLGIEFSGQVPPTVGISCDLWNT